MRTDAGIVMPEFPTGISVFIFLSLIVGKISDPQPQANPCPKFPTQQKLSL
jgi:hypothetical protein